MPKQSQLLADEIEHIGKRMMDILEKRRTSEDGVYRMTDEEKDIYTNGEKKLAELHDKKVAAEADERKEDAARNALATVNAPQYKAPFPGAQPGNAGYNLDYERQWQGMQKSFGQQFIESDAFKGYDKVKRMGPSVELSVKDCLNAEFKTTMDTATGYAPQAIRIPRMELYPTRPVAVIDLIPQGTTDQVSVVYMEETTFDNQAAEKAENVAYPEAALAFTERTSAVRKIAVILPVTDELLDDVAAMESYINQRLQFMIRQRLDSQLVVGNGTPPNLTGYINVSGINTQAKGTDPVPDAVYKGFTKIRSVGFAEPTNYITHPNDWQDVRLLRTTDGFYLYGSPYDAGPERIWGVPVTTTTAITENTALAGDFQGYAMVFWKKTMGVSVGYNNDDFGTGRVSVRAEIRLASVVFRPLSLTKYTSM